MTGGELANALVNICVALVVISTLYALVTVFFVEINPVVAVAVIIEPSLGSFGSEEKSISASNHYNYESSKRLKIYGGNRFTKVEIRLVLGIVVDHVLRRA